MTEDEARTWLRDALNLPREDLDRLDAFRRMVIEANKQQNLISSGTVDHIWARHIVDSAQLLAAPCSRETMAVRCSDHAPDSPVQTDQHLPSGRGMLPGPDASDKWLDLGTGAGFPGMVIAILRNAPITLVEARRRRAQFLRESADRLNLPHVSIELCRLESLRPARFGVISARAFAPLDRLLTLAHRFSTAKTLWLLPKGRSARVELESARENWHGVFHVKQSVTDPEAAILVASGVTPKRKP